MSQYAYELNKDGHFVVKTTSGTSVWQFNDLGCELEMIDDNMVFDVITYLVTMNTKNKQHQSFYQVWQEAEIYYENEDDDEMTMDDDDEEILDEDWDEDWLDKDDDDWDDDDWDDDW